MKRAIIVSVVFLLITACGSSKKWGGDEHGMTPEEVLDTPFVKSCLHYEESARKQGYSKISDQDAADQCSCRFLWAVVNKKPTRTEDDYGKAYLHDEKALCWDGQVPADEAPGLVEGMKRR